MAYGGIKFDNITFTNAGVDANTTVSGIYKAITSGVTVTGTISGNLVQGATVSGTTVTGTTASFTSGVFTTLSGATTTVTSGIFGAGTAAAPSIAFTGDPNTGIYSPGADQVAISTNGTRRLFVDASGNVGVGVSPSKPLDVRADNTTVRATCGSSNFTAFETAVDTGAGIRLGSYASSTTFVGSTTNHPVVFEINGSEKARLDTSGRLGLGTSSPAELLDIDGDGDSYLRWERDGTGGGYSGNTSGGVLRIGPYFSATDRELALYTDNSNNSWVTTGTAQALYLGTNKTARITIDSTGNIASSGRLLVGTGTANTSGAQLQTVDGLTFPATQVASSDPNTLDDYEEGTFSPTVYGSTTAGSTTYTYQNGRYTKVGRIVHIQLYVNWSSATGTGNMKIGGLPFTSSSDDTFPAFAVGEANSIALTASNVMTASVESSAANVYIAQYPVGGGTKTNVPVDSAGYIIIGGSYTI